MYFYRVLCYENNSTYLYRALLVDLEWAPGVKVGSFFIAVSHSRLVTLLFYSIYFVSEVLVVNHGSFQIQRIFSIF